MPGLYIGLAIFFIILIIFVVGAVVMSSSSSPGPGPSSVTPTTVTPASTPALPASTAPVQPVGNDQIAVPPVVSAATPERSDNRCGPSFGGAKCGPGRCCSIYGWCGSAGQPHCKVGINLPAYNGPGAVTFT